MGDILLALLDPRIPSISGGQVEFALTLKANCAYIRSWKSEFLSKQMVTSQEVRVSALVCHISGFPLSRE